MHYLVHHKLGIPNTVSLHYCLDRDGCEVDFDDLLVVSSAGEALIALQPGDAWAKVILID